MDVDLKDLSKMEPHKDYRKEFIVISIVFLVFTLIGIPQRKMDILMRDIYSPRSWLLVALIIGFTLWGLSDKRHRIINITTRHAITAFFVGYLSHVDLIYTIFFVTWLLNYYIMMEKAKKDGVFSLY